ncbi:ATP-binding protein [Streptomyces sp. NPDC004726]
MGTNGSTMLKPLRQGLPPIDPARASGSAACSLSARFEAVRGARTFTRQTLGEWNLDDRFDDVALVVSELVTNALRHALPDEDREIQDPPVRLHLLRWPGRLVCAVRDPSPQSPGASFGERPGAMGNGAGPYGDGAFADGTLGEGAVGGRPVGERPVGTGTSGEGTVGEGSFGDEAFDEGSFAEGAAFPDPCGPAESGRGLFLVDSFSDSWGWHPLAGTLHGKVVWALFRLS